MKVLCLLHCKKFPISPSIKQKTPSCTKEVLPTGDVAKLELVQSVTRLRIFKLLSFI